MKEWRACLKSEIQPEAHWQPYSAYGPEQVAERHAIFLKTKPGTVVDIAVREQGSTNIKIYTVKVYTKTVIKEAYKIVGVSDPG